MKEDIDKGLPAVGKLIDDKKFIGHAQEIIGSSQVNITSALENAETSAVGRALAFAGLAVNGSIASADEINKAKLEAGWMLI